MALYKDQFYLMDPANPPAAGTALNFVRYTLNDANNNNQFLGGTGDLVNGSVIQQSYPGDTITVKVGGSNITYTGTTFYLANGQRVFTPNTGQILQNGTFVKSTFVTKQGPLNVSQLGPACFTPGTLIGVPGGRVAIETLRIGDPVLTLDHGPQPLRWIGRQSVDGTGKLAPIRFAPGAIGNDRALFVSPQHRILWSGARAELLFAEPQVLVPALHLVGLAGVTREPAAHVVYIHLLFDRHELVLSDGVPTESFHPGGQMLAGDRALRAEIAAVFPGCPGLVQGSEVPAARPVLARHEARLLVA
ncbi:MAG: Hint domain-containing protein [Proteobacteria bacterium]|nr:Hint domain-containing protein [Pseudomonadota bacterium]MBS0574042.1 Hint domain-containing protein [Pseudomonadota bacterium]